jgi:hypothetical protein
MTAHFSPARKRRAALAESRIAGLRAYLNANLPELTRVMRVACGEARAADAAALADLLGSSRLQPERVFEALAEMRDALAAAETRAGDGHSGARPDLDAAIRWHGARLEDLILLGRR